MDLFDAQTLPELENVNVVPYQGGVKLITQDKPCGQLTLADCFELPYSVYLLNMQGETLNINHFGVEICGFASIEQAIGQTIFSVSKQIDASLLLENCQTVIANKNVKIFDENFVRHDGKTIYFLSFKFPCYNHKNLIAGVLGFSIIVGEQPISDALEIIKSLGLMPTERFNLHGAVLTNREQECLTLTVKGYSAKVIANQLKLSPRTVEEHLKNIRLKLNVNSKQQLIKKVTSSAPFK